MSPPSLPGPVGALELAGWQVTHHRHADELLGRVDDAEHGVEVLRAARGAERWRGALGDNGGSAVVLSMETPPQIAPEHSRSGRWGLPNSGRWGCCGARADK